MMREIIGRDTRAHVLQTRGFRSGNLARRPTPNEMGFAVTIGIAAAPIGTAGRPFIVTVTDMRESFGESLQGIDIGRTKFMRIAHDWGFLFAGGDARYAAPIARSIRQKLGGMTAPKNLEEVRDAACAAYREFREKYAVEKFLLPLHYNSIDEFKNNAKNDFGDSISELLKKVIEFDLGFEMLVFGFDEHSTSWLIDIANPGIAVEHDSPEEWAVGSGFDSAMAMLNARHPTPSERNEETYIYRLCEAKFAAELADTAVGRATAVGVWYPGGEWSIVFEKQISAIRAMCTKDRYRRIPRRAVRIIGDVLRHQEILRAAR
jgi:hypothetical protein